MKNYPACKTLRSETRNHLSIEHRLLDKMWQLKKNASLLFQPKYMLWVLKRTISSKHFLWASQNMFRLMDKIINTILCWQIPPIWIYETKYNIKLTYYEHNKTTINMKIRAGLHLVKKCLIVHNLMRFWYLSHQLTAKAQTSLCCASAVSPETSLLAHSHTTHGCKLLTLCKCYQQTIKVATSKERVNINTFISIYNLLILLIVIYYRYLHPINL